MEDGHGIALAGQIPGTDQTGQTGTDDGDTLLFARHGQGTGLHAQMLRAEDLQPVQVDGAPQIAAQAALFAGMVADAGQQARQGQITFQLFAGVAPAAFGGMAEEGARVQPQRTQGLATGRALLRAAGLHFMQGALAVHGNAHGDLGMPAGRGPASSCPMREAGNGYGTRHACGGRGRKNGAGQDGIPPAGCRQPCLHLTGDRRTGPPDSHCSIYFLGMAANTFSGYAGRWVTRAPQAL